MTYREISRPAGSESWTTTGEWVEWVNAERLAPAVAPVLNPTCSLCYGPVGTRYDQRPFPTCQHCNRYKALLDGLVPIAYSLDIGLESMLHRYKDWGPRYRWMRLPLASILVEFLERHLKCIQDKFGSIDIAATTPKGRTARNFDHLGTILSAVTSWPLEWEFNLLTKVRDKTDDRGGIDPDCYRVTEASSVEGRTVLLFDDTWTSGSTIASAAAALRRQGATKVVAITIGRQLAPRFGNAEGIIEATKDRILDVRRCVIDG